MNKFFFFFFLVAIVIEGYGQFKQEIFTMNYTYSPAESDDLDFSKTEIGLNIPIKIKKGFLSNTLGLNHHKMNFQNDLQFNTTYLEKVYEINYGFKYNYPLSDNWSLEVKVGASLISNLANNLTTADFLFDGNLMVEKLGGTIDRPSQFIFGLAYASITGRPKLLPLISYSKKVNKRFSYRIGFPKTDVAYHINYRNTLNGMIWLDGFYSNLSNPVYVNYEENAFKTSFSSISLGLNYSYKMDESWAIVFKGGYSLTNKYDLLDKENNIVYSFDTSTRPYFSTGVKFSLKNNKNKIK